MNNWHGAPILLLLLTGDLGLLRYSEACNAVSSVQCVNSTYFFWCVDIGDGSLTTIGNAEACPGILVCDDTQVEGCVAAGTVTTTELPLDTTTAASTDPTTINTPDLTTTEESSTTELTSAADLTTPASTDTTTIDTPDLTTTGESSTTESTPDLTTSASTDDPSDSTTEISSIVSDADFSCTYEGLYGAQDCSRFHVCYKFIWFIKHYFARCSEGLYWSSVEKRCVLKSLSDCP